MERTDAQRARAFEQDGLINEILQSIQLVLGTLTGSPVELVVDPRSLTQSIRFTLVHICTCGRLYRECYNRLC
jgi:hypothetical protein